MLGIECNGATFIVSSRRSPQEIVISRKNLFFSASKILNSIVVDIVKYLYLLYVITGKLLATHFFFLSLKMILEPEKKKK